jgi:hypothetical protein
MDVKMPFPQAIADYHSVHEWLGHKFTFILFFVENLKIKIKN